MGTLVISENITLDGVIEDPTGDDGFSRGGWFSRISEEDRQGWAEIESAQAFDAAAELYGRRTYEWLTTRWATREGAWADRLRTMPKYVVSATLEGPIWPNTTILRGDIVDEVARLKQQLDGELVVVGSGQLAHTLIEADLVDEFRLIVYPFVSPTAPGCSRSPTSCAACACSSPARSDEVSSSCGTAHQRRADPLARCPGQSWPEESVRPCRIRAGVFVEGVRAPTRGATKHRRSVMQYLDGIAREIIRERSQRRDAVARPTHPRTARMLRRLADRVEGR